MNKKLLLSTAVVAAFWGSAYADHPIAPPKIYQNKVETALIWVEPVTMAPTPTMKKDFKPTIHNEIDQHAIKGDKMGFGAGGWIPDCEVACTISKEHSDWRIVFSMMSMVANDGPHYGRNVQLDGPGKYYETCEIDPPDWRGFYRHTDKETGTGPFFRPYTIHGSFTFTGTGKAGGY
ncbi:MULTISPECIES: iron transporter [unclassified Francisella]|uniref:iron transporter n=1 Tax=unclassified Francisella TaxID=2610885 RepID=UPI002E36854B|nr:MULTISPECIES: iron transporter [unclassified Francisella]MED7820101.1 iron transporter [Francisella sp. 19S2-4]MED7830921.1 iron transporter [Francisella sp. 19S2-10]